MSVDPTADLRASLVGLEHVGSHGEIPPAVSARQAPANGPDWTPILPAEVALPEDICHPMRGTPSAVYPYLDGAGRLLYAVVRFERPGARKEILPYTYGRIGDQQPRWHWKAPSTPRPLFGLASLAARPDAPVLVVEGEKAVCVGEKRFSGHVVMTSMGGARAAAHSDWSSVVGCDVIIWPDNDHEGQDYAIEVARCAYAAGARRVRIVEVPSEQFPPKWDLADAYPEGFSLLTLTAMVAAASDAPCEPELPPGFELRDDGLWSTADGEGKGKEPPERWLSSPFELVAEARAAGGRGWALVMHWRDPDGRPHEWILPRESLHSEGADLERTFEDRGLRIAPDRKSRQLLREVLAGARVARRVEIADRNGWHCLMDGKTFAYMLPGGASSGPSAGRVLLRETASGTDGAGAFASAGNLVRWSEEVAALAVGNDLLVLVLCAAFAGPLLDIAEMRSFGAHLAGHSRTGKTTAVRVAASVWGSPEVGAQIRTWRATANGLEGAAAERNDNLLLLDEMAEADPREVDAVAYLLGNGSGKTRADRNGAARPTKKWRLVFLSTGEVDLATKIGEAGKRAMAGQEIRMPSLSADAGANLGIFQTLHGERSGAALAERLDAATRREHGTAGPVFVEKLSALRAADPAGLARRLIDAVNAYANRLAPSSSDGQARTLARHFALLAVTGDLAAEFGVLPWPKSEAFRGIEGCFRRLLERRGGLGRAEDRAAIDRVCSIIERHGGSRFQDIDAGDGALPVRDRLGFRKREDDGSSSYLFLNAAWQEEVCKGMDSLAVARALNEKRCLGRDKSSKHLTRSIRLPGLSGKARVYYVTSQIFEGNQVGDNYPGPIAAH